MPTSTAAVACVVIMLVTGTIAAISNKMLFDTKASGQCDNTQFTKPYFMTMTMFIGEFLCLIYYYAQQYYNRYQERRNLTLSSTASYGNYLRFNAKTRKHFASSTSKHSNNNNKFKFPIQTTDFDLMNQDLTSPWLGSEDTFADSDLYNNEEASDDNEQEIQQQQLTITTTNPGDDQNNLSSSNSNIEKKLSESGLQSPDSVSSNSKSFLCKTNLDHNHHQQQQQQELLLSPNAMTKHLTVTSSNSKSSPSVFFYLIFASLDLSATGVAGVGLEFVSASSNQMLRGSSIIFVALFSVLILKTKLNKYHWLSVIGVCLGLLLVGLSDYLSAPPVIPPTPSDAHAGIVPSSNSAGQQALGILLILLGTAINCLQNVLEEKLMKSPKYDSSKVSPLFIVGMEGLFGLILSCSLLLPIMQYIPGQDCGGAAENTYDSFLQIMDKPLILILLVGYILSLAVMNFYSMQLSLVQSAVMRNLIGAARIVIIWIVSLALYYVFTHHQFGEKLDDYSVLQLSGFVTLIGCTVAYSKANQKN